MMDILSEKSRKEYAESITELLRIEGKDLCNVCCFINEIHKLIKKVLKYTE
jgi:hypothetical protein